MTDQHLSLDSPNRLSDSFIFIFVKSKMCSLPKKVISVAEAWADVREDVREEP